jgi:hypothetical protein
LDARAYASAAFYAAQPLAAAVASERRVLDGAACGALRAVADAEATKNRDTVDGGPDHQVGLDAARLEELLGPAPAARLEALATGGEAGTVAAFARKYEAGARPWIPFHNDAASRTVNVALSPGEDDALLVVCGGAVTAVPRGEGDATIHDSSLLHGVRASPRARYSLILFFRRHNETPR